MIEQSFARRGLIGFFLSGLLLSMLGAILPVWRYHLEPDYLVIGGYFLFQNAGLLTALWWGDRLIPARGIRMAAILGSATACVALLYLAFFSPPAAAAWRMFGLFATGTSAGVLNAASFNAITPACERDPAATLNLAGALWGLGCLVSALVVAGTFFVYDPPSILVWLALIPGFATVFYAKSSLPAAVFVPGRTQPGFWQQVQTPAAVLPALFLFFQFGNEWAIAGWLPTYLVLRLGLSPGTALGLLALYWLSLLLGRIAAQWAFPRFSHRRMLLAGVVAPMFGCLILFFTNNLFGAITSVLLLGGGFSVIYPLIVERIGSRFPGIHPGSFNGIFAVAITGGSLAPASLGLLAYYFGVGVVIGLPLTGSIVVLVLLLLMELDARLTGTSES